MSQTIEVIEDKEEIKVEEVLEEKFVVPAFGYELIREVLIPDILGEETPKILYWAGKNVARKYPLESLSDIIPFFKQAGWGDLQVIKESKSELVLELSSEMITKRIKENGKSTFQLEAGFLAQQVENQKQAITEAFEHPRKRSGKVQITVKWDMKDFA
ncbi:YslB family protein [Niallia sp. Krafla_26]|uniref:YslB family protein n=1 Tax=Niallia sp. Krafla_26 TaxID=3064703 RepID=UPI003D183D1C